MTSTSQSPASAEEAEVGPATASEQLELHRKLSDAPFKPFRVKLSNSTAIDVTEPGSVIFGDTIAVLPVEVYMDAEGFRIVRNWKTISLSHVVDFFDLETKDRGTTWRKK